MEIGLLRFLLFSCRTTRLLLFINLTVIDALVTGVDQHPKSPRYLRDGWRLEVAISCTVHCRASAIIYRVLELMAIIN